MAEQDFLSDRSRTLQRSNNVLMTLSGYLCNTSALIDVLGTENDLVYVAGFSKMIEDKLKFCNWSRKLI